MDEDGSPELRVSDAAADFLANEARSELEAGVAQVHKSSAAFAAAISKPRRLGRAQDPRARRIMSSGLADSAASYSHSR